MPKILDEPRMRAMSNRYIALEKAGEGPVAAAVRQLGVTDPPVNLLEGCLKVVRLEYGKLSYDRWWEGLREAGVVT